MSLQLGVAIGKEGLSRDDRDIVEVDPTTPSPVKLLEKTVLRKHGKTMSGGGLCKQSEAHEG